MKIKTAEATGLQLDWGVAVVMGKQPFVAAHGTVNHVCEWNADNDIDVIDHKDPAVCMDACFKFGLIVNYEKPSARTQDGKPFMFGSTPAEAVARCVIAMRLGDEFECPSELGVMS